MSITATLDAAGWAAWGVWVTAVVYAIIGFLIWLQVKGVKQQVNEAREQVRETEKLREAELRPYVVLDFEVFKRRPIIFLTITNHGKTLARNVRFEFDPSLRSSLGQPKPGQVFMRHPDVETMSGATTMEALEGLWKEKGWYEVPPPPVDDFLSGIRLLTEGMPTLAPGKSIEIVFDSIFDRDGRPLPDAYTVRVSYDGDGGRHHQEEILLDLGIYRNVGTVTERSLTDVYDQLKTLVDTVKRWTSSWGGLKVWTRDDERKGDVELMRQHEEIRAAIDQVTSGSSQEEHRA